MLLIKYIYSFFVQFKRAIICSLMLFFVNILYGQNLGIKTNALYWATGTMNMAVEIQTGSKWTLEVEGGYNPWDFGSKQFKHWRAQLEMRYWFCYPFEGHYWGVHMIGGEFDLKGLPLPKSVFGSNSKDYRYQGGYLGGGFSYGYVWILSNRFAVDTYIGLGYSYVGYKKYSADESERYLGRYISLKYFGPTKLGVSLVYLIK